VSGILQCPYHGWTYDLEGRLVGAPLMDRTDGFQKEDYSLFDVSRVVGRFHLDKFLERSATS